MFTFSVMSHSIYFLPLILAAILPTLATVIPFNETKGHFGTATKIVIGLSLALGAAELVNYFTAGRSTALNGVNTATANFGVAGGGSGLPWDGFLSSIYQDLSGTVAPIVAGVAIIIAGLTFMWGETAHAASDPLADRAEWEQELQNLMAKEAGVRGWKSLFSRLVPRIKVFPQWWPASKGYGIWSYMHFILLSRKLMQEAPADVRRYVLGHELGHLRHGHTALNYLYPVLSAGVVTSVVFFVAGTSDQRYVAALCMAAFFVGKSSLLWFPLRRELQADDYSARLVGRETAIEGSLWMAHHNNDFSRQRRKRLRRLGYTIVSGGTSSRKTSFLNALLSCIPEEERVLTIEDSPELKPTTPNIVAARC